MNKGFIKDPLTYVLISGGIIVFFMVLIFVEYEPKLAASAYYSDPCHLMWHDENGELMCVDGKPADGRIPRGLFISMQQKPAAR